MSDFKVTDTKLALVAVEIAQLPRAFRQQSDFMRCSTQVARFNLRQRVEIRGVLHVIAALSLKGASAWEAI